MQSPNIYRGNVVGVSFEPAKSNIPLLRDFLLGTVEEVGEIEPVVNLIHNPNNKYDKNAIEVHVGYGDKTFFVGHIPKTHNELILQIGIENTVREFLCFNFDPDTYAAVGLAVSVNRKEP